MAPIKVEDGLVISIAYVLTLEDGEVVDESNADEPLMYLHGAENIIPGLENALTGMSVNEQKKVIVAPEDAYGEYDDDGINEMPRDFFPEDVEVEPGIVLTMKDEDGNIYDATITDIEEDIVTLDFNHPLAGETLTFDVTIVAIREATEEEAAHGHPHYPGIHMD